MRSARVVLPWSTCAMIEKLRMCFIAHLFKHKTRLFRNVIELPILDAIRGTSVARDQDVLRSTLRERTQTSNKEVRQNWKFYISASGPTTGACHIFRWNVFHISLNSLFLSKIRTMMPERIPMRPEQKP